VEVAKTRSKTQSKPARTPNVARCALILIWDWRAANSHIFGSDTSLRWHLRQHRDLYLRSGALLQIAGREYIDISKWEAALRHVGSLVAAGRLKSDSASSSS
jgi:hypothetical protein